VAHNIHLVSKHCCESFRSEVRPINL